MPDPFVLKADVKWESFGDCSVENKAIRVLTVDDNDALRYSVVRSLREAGYEVTEARTGAEALDLAQQVPDLITLDVNLPDMHGFDVCKKIKSDPRTAHIPVLHLSSSFVDPDARVQGLASGADAYLAEPIDRSELVATVGALLRLKNAESMARHQAAVAEKAREELAVLNATLEERVNERTIELKEANRTLKHLSTRVLELQDDERRRIARELHDSVGQSLVAIKMNNALLARDPGLPSELLKTVAENDMLADDVLKSIRTISHLLHPPLLDESGLSSALRWYVDEFSKRSGIAVELDCSRSLARYPEEFETAVFRIVQECLGNVYRHAKSSTAIVQLDAESGVLNLRIQDQGRGILPERQKELNSGIGGGVGIRGMKERLTRFGGELQVISDANGTTVTAVVPITELRARA